jgi:hypothetical protein
MFTGAVRAALAAVSLCAMLRGATAVNNNWPRYVPTITTGNVSLDFPRSEPGVLVIADTVFEVSVLDELTSTRRPTGWDIHDVRFAYDNVTDTMYIGAWALCGRVAVRSRACVSVRVCVAVGARHVCVCATTLRA